MPTTTHAVRPSRKRSRTPSVLLELGFIAVKDHFYHPVDENIRWLTAIREAVGDEIDCMHDPVAIYTYEEAIKVGRTLEDLEYRWFEEPLPET